MRRRTVRPFGSSIPASRAFSMLIGLAVVWVLFDTMRQPDHWNWLAANEAEATAPPIATAPSTGQVKPEKPSFSETVVPGPNDLDPAVLAEFVSQDELITDKAELRSREMIAYWELLSWSRSQSFEELERRARRDPAMVQIWEEPKKHRGRPFRLKLHIRRVLEWETDPKQNPLGVTRVYEAMGWTDESKSLPYSILFTEKPPQMPIGDEVEADVVFVGYFFKILAYTAYNSRRATPLLMGRVRMAPKIASRPSAGASPLQIGGLFIAGLVGLGIVIWFIPRRKKRSPPGGLSRASFEPQWIPLEEGGTTSPMDVGPSILPEINDVFHKELADHSDASVSDSPASERLDSSQ